MLVGSEIKNNFKTINQIFAISLSSGMAGDKNIYNRYLIGKKSAEHFFNQPINEPPNSLKGSAILKADPKLRASDFNFAIQASNNLMIANIGGNDCDQIIPYLNQDHLIKYQPLLLGYSDITSLHLFLYTKGIQSYYGPSILDGFAENGGMDHYTKKYLDKALFKKEWEIKPATSWTSQYLEWSILKNNYQLRKKNVDKKGFQFYGQGVVLGHLMGGCIDTIAKIKNKPFFPKLKNWEGAILFLETSEAKISPQQLMKFLKIIENEIAVSKAIIFGKPQDEKYFTEYKSVLKTLNKPFVFNLNFGHTMPMITIPYGAKCTLNFELSKIKVSNVNNLSSK